MATIELEGEIRERWMAIQAAKRAKAEGGSGSSTVRDALTVDECDRAMGDTADGITSYERQQRKERAVAKLSTVNGKHATNGATARPLPTCETCGREMVAMAGGKWHRCFKCKPGGKGRVAEKTPAAPAGQERRAEADPPTYTAPQIQAGDEALITLAPAAGDTLTTARDLGALARFALPDFVELEPAEEDLDAELRAFRSLMALPPAGRRRVLAFAGVAGEAVGAN